MKIIEDRRDEVFTEHLNPLLSLGLVKENHFGYYFVPDNCRFTDLPLDFFDQVVKI